MDFIAFHVAEIKSNDPADPFYIDANLMERLRKNV